MTYLLRVSNATLWEGRYERADGQRSDSVPWATLSEHDMKRFDVSPGDSLKLSGERVVFAEVVETKNAPQRGEIVLTEIAKRNLRVESGDTIHLERITPEPAEEIVLSHPEVRHINLSGWIISKEHSIRVRGEDNKDTILRVKSTNPPSGPVRIGGLTEIRYRANPDDAVIDTLITESRYSIDHDTQSYDGLQDKSVNLIELNLAILGSVVGLLGLLLNGDVIELNKLINPGFVLGFVFVVISVFYGVRGYNSSVYSSSRIITGISSKGIDDNLSENYSEREYKEALLDSYQRWINTNTNLLNRTAQVVSYSLACMLLASFHFLVGLFWMIDASTPVSPSLTTVPTDYVLVMVLSFVPFGYHLRSLK